MIADVIPVLELSADVLCAKSCRQLATLCVELDATPDGDPVCELWCGDCFDAYERL
jgi:hypothetical protein